VISDKIALSIRSLVNDSTKGIETPFNSHDALLKCFGIVSSHRQQFDAKSIPVCHQQSTPKRVISDKIAGLTSQLQAESKSFFAVDSGIDLTA
jgi:hypothetical protein